MLGHHTVGEPALLEYHQRNAVRERNIDFAFPGAALEAQAYLTVTAFGALADPPPAGRAVIEIVSGNYRVGNNALLHAGVFERHD